MKSSGLLAFLCRFGDEYVPGNLLTGFGFFEPYWLVVMANLAIVIHLFGGYQVSPYALPSVDYVLVGHTMRRIRVPS